MPSRSHRADGFAASVAFAGLLLLCPVAHAEEPTRAPATAPPLAASPDAVSHVDAAPSVKPAAKPVGEAPASTDGSAAEAATSAADADATAAADAASSAEAAPALGEASDIGEAPDAVDAAAAAPVVAADVDAQRHAELSERLSAVEEEIDGGDTVLPWTVVIVGLAATLAAVVSSTVDTLACEDSCSGGAWQSLTILGGATVTVVGATWLRSELIDRDQLDLRRDRIERQLQNLRDAREPIAGVGIRLRGHF